MHSLADGVLSHSDQLRLIDLLLLTDRSSATMTGHELARCRELAGLNRVQASRLLGMSLVRLDAIETVGRELLTAELVRRFDHVYQLGPEPC